MPSELELWGGIECTVNRIDDYYFDQVERTGHARRISDLDPIARLGVRALRYPVLWERTAKTATSDFDFAWADERLQRLRELGIRPIVGLVHHGSGPRGTSLLDDNFAPGLARFARAVAKRYPWVKDFTPVNEPLTTARFSGLYGHWYPHRRDASSFIRALVNQIAATRNAMDAIREVTPEARLVQTEDFGRVFSASRLKYQAAFENHRQWLGLDLLFGRVNRYHPLYRYLITHGVTEQELTTFEQSPCAPDIIGINYYVTSDRYLDDAISRYPSEMHGTNGKDQYVDIEAVRVRPVGIVGHRGVIEAAWSRYKAPVALTEVHLGCTPDEQGRWLLEAWRAAESARGSGIDVRALTLWSLLGAYDWDSLVTVAEGHYEAGAFDVRGGFPNPTLIANIATHLSQHPEVTHTLEHTLGWWRRSERFVHELPTFAEPMRPAVSGQD